MATFSAAKLQKIPIRISKGGKKTIQRKYDYGTLYFQFAQQIGKDIIVTLQLQTTVRV